MVALAAVGTILVATVNSYASSLRAASEIEQFNNLLNQVAAKANEIIAVTEHTNSSTRVFLQMPATVGYQQYWVRARNDSSNSWIEGSFGEIRETTELNRIYLPKGISASGYFVGGHGPAVLESSMNGSIPQFRLASLGD